MKNDIQKEVTKFLIGKLGSIMNRRNTPYNVNFEIKSKFSHLTDEEVIEVRQVYMDYLLCKREEFKEAQDIRMAIDRECISNTGYDLIHNFIHYMKDIKTNGLTIRI